MTRDPVGTPPLFPPQPGETYANPIWHGRWRIYAADADARAFGGYAYEYVHDDYDGAPDANDNRHGFAKTLDEAKYECDALDEENAPDCYVCGGDCAGANPPVMSCPMRKD